MISVFKRKNPCDRAMTQPRLKEHGGGYWLGQIYDDWFGFVIDEPISLRQGMDYLMRVRINENDIMKFDDGLNTFMLKGCGGQQQLATALEFFQDNRSDSFGVKPPLY